MAIRNILIFTVRGPSFYVRICRIKTVPALKGLTGRLYGSFRLAVTLRCADFESQPGPMFVNEVVHIQCSILFKDMECPTLAMVLCTIKNN